MTKFSDLPNKTLPDDPILCRGRKEICILLKVRTWATAKKRLHDMGLPINRDLNHPILLVEEYRQKQAQRTMELPKAMPEGPEAAIEKAIFDSLPNWPRKRRQVENLYGVIDILIISKPPTIIEVKNKPNLGNVQRAIGQLLLYRMSYPDAQLYAAFSERLPKKLLLALNKLGINEWKGGSN